MTCILRAQVLRRCAGTIPLLCLLAPLPSAATEDEMMLFSDIPSVFGASRHEQEIGEAPSSVSIITADEIRKYGHRTLADILASVRGFSITNDRNYSYLGARGFNRPGDYNSRFLLLIDGHRLNDNIYDSALIGTEGVIDVDLIDHIEIIRGPSSSLYGNNAFFGVISVITRRGGHELKGPELAAAAANNSTGKGRASYGNRLENGLEILLSASSYRSAGYDSLYYPEFDAPGTNNGFARNADADRSDSVFGKFHFENFTLHTAFSTRTKNIPTASFGTVFGDPGTRTTDQRGYLDLQYRADLTGFSDITARLYYDAYDYHGDYIYSAPDRVNLDDAQGNSLGAEILYSRKLATGHKLTLGAEYKDNLRQDQSNRDITGLFLDDRRKSLNWGAYAQDEFTLGDNWLVNAGLRHDYSQTAGGSTNPRLALIYRPRETTAWKFLYGSAFRAPNVYELYYNDGGNTQKASQGLKPETIKTAEVVLEQSLAPGWFATASVYRYRINDLIDQMIDPADGLLVFRNLDSVMATGLELELDGKTRQGYEGRASVTYQDNATSAGGMLTNSPHLQAKLNLIAPFAENLHAGLEMRYISRRRTIQGNMTDAALITNLTLLSQNLRKDLKLSASIYNLFDRKYDDPGGTEHLQDQIRQDGRAFRLKAELSY
ncbi:MAG: TonB-dependent receptor [Sulfuricella sp.]|nr:TonB-dependent receptor [Sulfuricella sp.]